MQYVLFILCSEPERWEALAAGERNAIHAACGAWHEELVDGGHAILATAFEPPDASVTVSQRDGKGVITHGPFDGNPVAMGGFEVVECASLDEAIALAERFPALSAGFAVEVRPTLSGGCKD